MIEISPLIMAGENVSEPAHDDFNLGNENARFSEQKIGMTPFVDDNSICGFLLSGRWPINTLEWVHTLLAAVRIASIPGLLETSTVFDFREEKPLHCADNVYGLFTAVQIHSLSRTHAHSQPTPPALMVLHPPSETQSSLPEHSNSASGCLLLPGAPHLGLEHRAGWVEATHDNIITLRTKAGIELSHDPDTAILGMLLAA